MCCCPYHENFKLLISGMRRHFPNLPQPEELIQRTVCGCNFQCYYGICNECSDYADNLSDVLVPRSDDPDFDIPYYQWTGQYRKVLVTTSLSEAKIELFRQLAGMRAHTFIAKSQLYQVKKLRQRLSENEAVLQEDFSENFAVQQQNEIMSAHWIKQEITVFTTVLYHDGSTKSFCVISDELHHDKYSVAAFNRSILKKCNINGKITNLHVFSDGAGSQFKNRYTLSNIIWPKKLNCHLGSIDWSFFGTAHGKGPVDGVGGTVKRGAWWRILSGEVIVNNASEFADAARSCCPNIQIIHVPSNEIDNVRREFQEL